VLICSQTRGGRLALAMAAPSRPHPRQHHLGEIGLGVAAADAAPGQVDDDLTAVDNTGPRSQCLTIPGDLAVTSRPSGQDHDLVASSNERPVQDRADLTGPARNHYPH
jgi:hypothetical protein